MRSTLLRDTASADRREVDRKSPALGARRCRRPGGRELRGEEPPAAITVFAAASLTESFTQLGKDFEATHPGAKVTFSFGASSTLAQQINSGAPADVLAAASPATMKVVTDARNGTGPAASFARNQLVIAVPKGNPKGIKTLADTARPGVKVAMCAKQVPCGAAARKAVAAAGGPLTPVTLEQDVKTALTKARLGEVDVALVYRTDVRATAADGEGIEFPESAGVVNTYPIVALKQAPNPSLAKAFVEYVLSDRARSVLTAAGFEGLSLDPWIGSVRCDR